MESGFHLEGNGSGEAKKSANPHFTQPILDVIFEVFEHLLQCIFSGFFRKAFFSYLGDF